MDELGRFVAAQATSLEWARRELRAGRKESHWMWYIFPQLAGLGRSERARYYGIAGGAEARAYLAHPLLGPRLAELAGLVLAQRGRTAEEIFGPVDAMKLRSSMTLFAAQPGADPVFAAVLDAFFGGARCPATLAALGQGAG